MELDREMYMDAELISKFITQQVTVAMAEKTKQYEKKIKKLEKGGRNRVLGDSSSKNGTRGGGCASNKNKNTRPKQIPSQDHHRNLRLNQHKAKIASFGAPRGEDPKKQVMTTAVRQEMGKRNK